MNFNSPLRYPGGKNKLSRFIASICEKNDVTGHYVEPYAGGAAVALHLLLNGYVREITINDLDRSVYAFWYSILNHPLKFCNKIKNIDITIKNWKKFKKIQNNKKKAPLFELGFSTFFLNRTNYSGIIDGGMIGGIDQTSEYEIDCRFNKKQLIQRIKRISKYKNQIHLYNLDALNLIKKIQKKSLNENIIFYFDPPYYLKGPSLYMNHYEQIDHRKVANKIKQIKKARWIVSYDNVREIKKLYSDYNKKEYLLFHNAYKIRQGKEVLFFSNNLKISRIIQPIQISS